MAAVARRAQALAADALRELRKFAQLPWKMQGPVAAPEWLPSITNAADYRPVSPASHKVKVSVPHALPENVYNISYQKRDTRRASVVRAVEVIDVSPGSAGSESAASASVEDPMEPKVEAAVQETEALAGAQEGQLPTPGKFYYAGKEFHLNDVGSDGGYAR